jgi:hypothetical protein
MANHMLIGLGGTGGRIVRSFRKKIYENFRSEDPNGVNIRYLYIDSSDELMKQDDPDWKVLGRSVQLKKESQLLIKGMSLDTVLNDLSSYPGISPWLGDREQFRSILGTIGAENIFGGQKRRLGRFLFACKAPEFRQRVQSQVNALQLGGMTATTFHVCCGLAGGTGSGSVVDVVSQIRSLYPHEGCRIIIYAFLPEEYPDPNKAKENYHANGYAALLELNGLAVSAWRPHDVSGISPGRLQIQSPFDCCYLFSDVNEANQRVDVVQELWDIVASFLYQKIVAAKHFNWQSLERQEKYENCEEGMEAEKSSEKGRPERCRLFFGFGIKQIAYPEEEIREYLTYSFARQASLQLRYNHWNDTQGFLDEPVNRGYAERVKQDSSRQRWKMTDEHLSLSLGILPDEINSRQWKPIGEYWENLLPNLKGHVKENTKDRKSWNDALKRLCATAYGENYRSLGVPKFYETKQRDMGDQVREIRRLLEEDLFEEWRNGSMSMHDIARLLEALVEDLEVRKTGLGPKIERAKENTAQFEGLVTANDREWAKVGLVSEALGKYDRLFDAQGNHLRDLYAARTRVAGMEYSKRLLDALASEILSLSNEVAECAQLLADCAKEFDERMKRRCCDEGGDDVTRVVVRFYKPQAVKDFEKKLRLDDGMQKKQTAAVRQRLAELLGEDRRFGLFRKKLARGVLLEELEQVCDASATQAHEDLAGRDKSLARILNVSVVERLYREYSGNPEGLRSYAERVVSNAKTFLPLDISEVNRKSPGIPKTDKTQVTYFSVLMPDSSGYEDFSSQLGRELIGATGFGGSQDVIINPAKKNEITLVCVRNVMPARYSKAVAMLRKKYEARMAQVSGTAHAMELHAEGDGTQFPSLFVRSVSSGDVRPYILIAQAMGLIQVLPDPVTEVTKVCLVTRNDKGRVSSQELGESLDDVLKNVGQNLMDQLQELVDRSLATDYIAKSKRDGIIAQINSEADSVLQRVGGNPQHPEYKTYCEAADKVEEIMTRRRSAIA